MKMHLIKTNDDTLYEVIHQEPETKQLDIDFMKRKYLCGTVFRKDGLYWFVRKIEEAQIVTDEEVVIEKPKKRGRPKKENLEKQ